MMMRAALIVLICAAMVALAGVASSAQEIVNDPAKIYDMDVYIDEDLVRVIFYDRDNNMCALSGEVKFYKKKGRGKEELQMVGEQPLSIESLSDVEWEPIASKTFSPSDFSWFKVVPDKKHYGITTTIPNLRKGDVVKAEWRGLISYATIF